jgi:hypothetical protein
MTKWQAWGSYARDGAMVWSLVLAVVVIARLDSRCWTWRAIGFLVLETLAWGVACWIGALFLSAFILGATAWYWLWPPVPPDEELDEGFPEQRTFLHELRERNTRYGDYALRFGAITAQFMAGAFTLAKLPSCP